MRKTVKTRSGRVLELPTPREDAAIDAGIAADPGNPEWSQAEFARARPASEVFDKAAFDALAALKRKPGQRGPQKAPLKQATTIRFDADVLATLKATGPGWQTRVNEAMRDWVKAHCK
jgi:uncharacterized protein (DUF4415 family)